MDDLLLIKDVFLLLSGVVIGILLTLAAAKDVETRR